MKSVRMIVAVGALGLVVSTAFAQALMPDDGRFRAEFDQRPVGQDYANAYPAEAVRRDAAGIAMLCCIPRDDRRLACRVAFEWPENFGFGDASLRVARRLRMTRASFDAYRSTRDAWMQIPMRWCVYPMRADVEPTFTRISEETRGLCRPKSDVVVAPRE
jgi:hypothetical protein